MVRITESARLELHRLLVSNLARPQQGVRLRLSDVGDLRMTIDVPHPGDSVIRRDYIPLLIVDVQLAQRLARRVLDFAASSTDRPSFKLGWHADATAPGVRTD